MAGFGRNTRSGAGMFGAMTGIRTRPMAGTGSKGSHRGLQTPAVQSVVGTGTAGGFHDRSRPTIAGRKLKGKR